MTNSSRWLLIACFVLAATESSYAQGKLEGVWIAEKGDKKMELRFNKGKFSATTPGGKMLKGTYKVDNLKKPKHLDIMLTEGAKVKGKKALCIYEVDGDTLRWCANDPTKGNPRAKAFPDKQGARREYIYLVFKRAK